MSILGVLPTIGNYITSGFDQLPTAIGVSTLFLGTTMMNVSYIFLGIGITFFVPFLIFLMNNTIGARFQMFNIDYWLPLMIFICTYIGVNAGYLIAITPDGSAPDYMVQSRRSQASFALIYSVAFFVLAWWYAHTFKGINAIGKVSVSILLGAGLAVAWYQILTVCGATQLTDIFGITSRLFNKPDTPSPTVCYTTSD